VPVQGHRAGGEEREEARGERAQTIRQNQTVDPKVDPQKWIGQDQASPP
jgi:hypothetical protein